MAVIGEPRSFHEKFSFLVEVDDFGSAGFQSCSELSAEVAEISYYEGGALIPDKQPGRATFADLTLERGATKDRDTYDWFLEVVNAARNAGLVSPDFKRNLTIVQLNRNGEPVRRWRVYGAWVKKFVAGAWDNNSDEHVMEQLVLAFDYFELIQA